MEDIVRYVGCGVATISRLLKIIGLFCKRALQKRLYSAKETCNFKEPTNRSHPISEYVYGVIWYVGCENICRQVCVFYGVLTGVIGM